MARQYLKKPPHLRRLISKLEIAAVPHGFRSSFRDWAAEETDHPREVVEAAYMRSDLFERRRRPMNDWASYFGGRELRTLGHCFKRRSGSSFEGVRIRGLVRLT